MISGDPRLARRSVWLVVLNWNGRDDTLELLSGLRSEPAQILFVDNGVGFTQNGTSKRRGLGLVKRLMQQVEGSAELRSDHGTAWTLKFPVPKPNAIPAAVATAA